MNEPKKPYSPSQQAQRNRTTGAAATSRRRMSAGRKIWYGVLVAIGKGLSRLIWSTCKVDKVIGAEHMAQLRADGHPMIPCYWHQMHVFCSRYMLDQLQEGLKVGFLISPSVSGEVPAALARSWGATVVRGSPTRTGGQALRDMFLTVSKDKVSPVITVDGPKGPAEEVKIGAVLLARLTKAPMVPMAYACSSGFKLSSWDRFLIPRPFSRVVIIVGAPMTVPPGTPIDALEPTRVALENELKKLAQQANETFDP